MVAIPPPEFLEEIKALYGLEFVPQPFRKKKDFEWALVVLGSTPGEWSDDIWDEYVHYDSILAQDDEGRIYRFIRTIIILVIRNVGTGDHPVIEYLYEIVELPDGTSSERSDAESSMSEKLRWREKSGRWTVRLTQRRLLVRRAAREELGITLKPWHLAPPWLVRADPRVLYRKGSEIDPVLPPKGDDPNKPDKRRPGIITRNYLYSGDHLRLPKRYWKREYRERKYRKGVLVKTLVHRWRPWSRRYA